VAGRVTERIHAAVATPILIDEVHANVALGASIGIEVGPQHQVQGALMRAADDAMYRGKRERKVMVDGR
jgi:GGDEF domain-containing protein